MFFFGAQCHYYTFIYSLLFCIGYIVFCVSVILIIPYDCCSCLRLLWCALCNSCLKNTNVIQIKLLLLVLLPLGLPGLRPYTRPNLGAATWPLQTSCNPHFESFPVLTIGSTNLSDESEVRKACDTLLWVAYCTVNLSERRLMLVWRHAALTTSYLWL